MRPNVPALPTHNTSMRAAPSDGQQQHHARHQDLAGDGGQAEPQRHRAVDDDGDDRRPHQQPVRRRVEDLAERGHLVEAAGHVAVDPVGGAEHGQQDGGLRLVVQPEEQPEEQRDAEQPHQGDDVRGGEDAVQTSRRPRPRVYGSALRRPWPAVCQSGTVPRFDPFRGLRYRPDVAPIAQVIAPPYDVISPTERVHLASRHPANCRPGGAARGRPAGGRDRYAVATDLFMQLADRRRPGRRARGRACTPIA